MMGLSVVILKFARNKIFTDNRESTAFLWMENVLSCVKAIHGEFVEIKVVFITTSFFSKVFLHLYELLYR